MSREKRKLLEELSVEQLIRLAEENGVKITMHCSPYSLSKSYLISILEKVPKITIDVITKFIKRKKSIGEIESELSSAEEIPQDVTGKSRDRLKGREFEKIVAKWAKSYFNADMVKLNHLRRGYRTKRPYEIDVWVHKERGILSDEFNIWIECKNVKGSIKRDTVMKLVSKMKDVNDAVEEGLSKEGRTFDYGVIVTTSRFDIDALEWATDYDIACFRYENGRFIKENEVDWI